MKRFFAKDILSDQVILTDDELHHCLHVLRTKDGESIEVIDGKGNLWLCTIHILSKNQVQIQIRQTLVTSSPNNSDCILAVAMTKNQDRLEWLIEKATELGLKEFYPLITQRTERKHLRMDRLEKIAIAATKQSKRLWKPVIREPVTFMDFLNIPMQAEKYVAHCENESDKKSFSKIYEKGNPTVILIGPEGDFTEEEIHRALKNGYIAVSLGAARLRVETAALAACAWINLKE